MAEHIANPWGGPSVIGQNAAFSGHPPLAARLVASRPARCESTARLVGADCGRWLCEGGSESLPSLGDGGGPPPGGVDPESDLSGAAGDAGGDVQHPVAEGFDLTRGQVAVFGEADQFGPGHQICCREDDSSHVALALDRWQAGWPAQWPWLGGSGPRPGRAGGGAVRPPLAGDHTGRGVGDECGHA